jgi:hypothetical protein
VSPLRRFYRDAEEWAVIVERLKLTACPHCQVVGALIRHGSLCGYDETSPRRQVVRARRIFCSNRRIGRPGCGKTFSVWLVDKIRRLSLTTGALWRFLQQAVAVGILAAGRAVDRGRSERAWQRLWKRFVLAQTTIRTALHECGPLLKQPTRAPPTPSDPPDQPSAETIAHLRAAFADARCPIAAFQYATHAFFV